MDALKAFGADSIRLLRRCTKPDRAQFVKVATRTGLGVVAAGFVGFFVKLVFIPVNQIILSTT